MAIPGYFFALACALIVIAGDALLKIAADKGVALSSPLFVGGIALYAASGVAWYLAMKHITLAQAGVAYAMFSLLALCAMGVVFFGETLAPRDLAGIACAIAAILLLVRFA